MASEPKDGWDKIAIVTAVIGSLFLPLIIFFVGKNYEEAEARRLAQQKEIEEFQRNADRVAALLTHLASDNSTERLLTIRYVDYLIQNGLFPKELSEQEVLLRAAADENTTVAHAASHTLAEAVTSNPTLRQSVEQAAQTDPETKRIVIRAAELNPKLKAAININQSRE